MTGNSPSFDFNGMGGATPKRHKVPVMVTFEADSDISAAELAALLHGRISDWQDGFDDESDLSVTVVNIEEVSR